MKVLYVHVLPAFLWGAACAALALYLLDVTFRLAQQAFPVRLHVASVDPTGQLAQLHMAVDSLSTVKPLQVMIYHYENVEGKRKPTVC